MQNPEAERNRRSPEHPALSPALAVGWGLGMWLNSRNCHKNHLLRQSTPSGATEVVNIQSLCLLCFSPRFSWLLLNTQLLVRTRNQDNGPFKSDLQPSANLLCGSFQSAEIRWVFRALEQEPTFWPSSLRFGQWWECT